MDNWGLATFHNGPFVGRAREINGLIDTYQAVRRGQTRIVILKGTVGIGKTRLATEFLHRMKAEDAHILQGRPFGGYTCPPYQPLFEALRNYCPDMLPYSDLQQYSCFGASRQGVESEGPLSSQVTTAAVEKLYDAAAQSIQQLAQEHPVVLFIDSLTWADTATLDMLYGVSQRWLASHTPVMLLLAFRQEALITRQTLAEWSTRMEQELRAVSLSLDSLGMEHVTQFIRQLFDKSAGSIPDVSLEALGRWLFSETRGLPLYMVEVLDTLLDHNIVKISSQANGNWSIDLTTPALNASKLQSILRPNMRAVIRARLALLSPHASTLLAAGAVLARTFSFEEVRLIADLEDQEGCAALDEILARHLLDNVGDGYFFTHDIIRDIVYAEIPEAQRRDLHQRALQVLQVELADDPVHTAEKASHADAAGLWDRAFHLYVTAGDYALQLLAIRNAIDLYEEAGKQFLTKRSMWATLAVISASDLQHHHLQLGHAYELIGKREQAHAVYSNMVIQARRAGYIEYVRVGLNHLARLIKDYKVDFAEAQALRHQMLQLPNNVDSDCDKAIQAETEMHIAQLSFYRFDAPSTLMHGKRALQLARELGLHEIAARSLHVLSLATLVQCDWEAVISYASEARELYQALQKSPMESLCLKQIAKASISTGHLQEGFAAAREAYKIDVANRDPSMLVYSTYHLVTALLESGAYAEALSLAQQTMTTARTQNQSLMLALALTALGRVYRALLDIPGAYRAHSEALTLYRTLPQEPLMELIDADICVDCVLVGNWEEAHIHAMQALNQRNRLTYGYQTLTRWYETDALLRAGELQRATQDIQHFEEETRNNPRYRIPYLRSQALLARHHKQNEQALECLHQATELAQHIDLPGELWSLEAERAELFALGGNLLEAKRSLAHAAEIIHKLADGINDLRARSRFLENERVRQILSK